jgi:hypothetical protein
MEQKTLLEFVLVSCWAIVLGVADRQIGLRNDHSSLAMQTCQCFLHNYHLNPPPSAICLLLTSSVLARQKAL